MKKVEARTRHLFGVIKRNKKPAFFYCQKNVFRIYSKPVQKVCNKNL